MKWLHLFTSLALIYINTADEDSLDHLPLTLSEQIAKKCENIGGKPLVEKFKHNTHMVKICMKVKSTFEKVCSKTSYATMDCLTDFTEKMKECLRPEEKYLPGFVVDALNSLLGYMCADEQKALSKLMSNEATLDCTLKLITTNEFHYICNDKFDFAPKNTSEYSFITKPELCKILNEAKICYADYVERKCPEGGNLKEVVIGIYDAVSSQCGNQTIPFDNKQ